MNKVIVVESAAKTKTIRRFLRGEYDVIACGGHIVDLPDDSLGVDIENNFELDTVPIRFRGQDKVKRMRERLADAGEVLLATDPDREGEAIAADLLEHCVPYGAEAKRIEFNAIVYHAVKEALENPREIHENRVQAQRARRALDRLIGFIISSMTQFDPEGPGLPAAGRVMAPAVSLVVDREIEAEKFEVRHYWTLQCALSLEEENLQAQLSGEYEDFELVKNIVKELKEIGNMQVLECDQDPEDKLNPLPPYTTDALQDDADNLLGFTPRRTMHIAQQLYQGVEIDGSSQALITYMRTDSSRVSPYAMGLARQAFENREDTPDELYQGRPWQPGSGQQDAHEAIRPTMPEKPDFFPENLEGKIDEDFLALYKIIYYRFLASQASSALYHRTDLTLQGGDYRAEATGYKLKEEGFLRFYNEFWPRYSHEEVELPDLEFGEQLDINKVWPEPEQTYPPPRYREGSLVRELKTKGIGRPSTYGDILQKIKRGRGGYGYTNKVRGKLRPTERGFNLCDYLRKKFHQVISYSYTAKMEKNLELIEQGQLSYEDFLKEEFEWLKEPYRITRSEGWLSGDLPSPAQVEYLKKLGEEVDMEIPDEVFKEKSEVSEWIDKLQEQISPVVRIGPIEPADVSGVSCYRFRLYFNRPLPDEEKEFVKKEKMKYQPGGKGRMPAYQFQRQNKERVEELRQELIERYTGENSPLEAEFEVID